METGSASLLLVCYPAAGRLRAGGIERGAAFFNGHDLAVGTHDKGHTVGDAHLRDENAVLLRHRPHVIAEHREAGIQFLLPMRQRRREIGTDGQNLHVHFIELGDTRLVRG